MHGLPFLRGEFLGEGERDFPFFFLPGDVDERRSRSRSRGERCRSFFFLPRESREDDRELLLRRSCRTGGVGALRRVPPGLRDPDLLRSRLRSRDLRRSRPRRSSLAGDARRAGLFDRARAGLGSRGAFRSWEGARWRGASLICGKVHVMPPLHVPFGQKRHG